MSKALEKYLAKMVCSRCSGKGCNTCKHTGGSGLFRKLQAAASTGIK